MTRIFHWFFMWKIDPMPDCDIRLVFTLPPRDSTLQNKRCVQLWNNFPCIITLVWCWYIQVDGVKGTADVSSSDPPLTEWHVRCTTVPLKTLSDPVWVEYPCVLQETYYFHLLFLFKSDLRIFCIRYNEEINGIKKFFLIILAHFLLQKRWRN